MKITFGNSGQFVHARNRGNSSTGMLLALVMAICLIALAAAFLLDTPDVREPLPADAGQELEPEPFRPTPLPPPSERIVEEYQLAGDLPDIDLSDPYVRGHLMFLAGDPLLSILQGEQLIRRVVTQVDSISKGSIVHQHSPIVLPENRSLAVIESEQGFVLDPSSYQRYDNYANILSNIDPELLIAFYGFYEPLFEKADMELGNPEGAFRGAFVTALAEILKAPIVEGEIALHQPEVNWEFISPELENLNTVQKQLIRMGPENTRKIQQSLQPLHDALVGSVNGGQAEAGTTSQ